MTRHNVMRLALRRGVAFVAAASVAMCVAVAPPAAQQAPPDPTKEDLAKDNKLFITLARKALKWDEPTAPSKIVGPLHYVGTAGLASYLFATEGGAHPLQHRHARVRSDDRRVDPDTRLRCEGRSRF